MCAVRLSDCQMSRNSCVASLLGAAGCFRRDRDEINNHLDSREVLQTAYQ